jgi:hypothetical protein
MAKLPKDHPIIVELTKKIERAKEETKELNRVFYAQLRATLEKTFDKQLTKHKDKTEKLLKELEIIASRKQN